SSNGSGLGEAAATGAVACAGTMVPMYQRTIGEGKPGPGSIKACGAWRALIGAAPMGFDDTLKAKIAQVEKGGAEKYHAKNKEVGKLFARDRIAMLVDA